VLALAEKISKKAVVKKKSVSSRTWARPTFELLRKKGLAPSKNERIENPNSANSLRHSLRFVGGEKPPQPRAAKGGARSVRAGGVRCREKKKKLSCQTSGTKGIGKSQKQIELHPRWSKKGQTCKNCGKRRFLRIKKNRTRASRNPWPENE